MRDYILIFILVVLSTLNAIHLCYFVYCVPLAHLLPVCENMLIEKQVKLLWFIFYGWKIRRAQDVIEKWKIKQIHHADDWFVLFGVFFVTDEKIRRKIYPCWQNISITQMTEKQTRKKINKKNSFLCRRYQHSFSTVQSGHTQHQSVHFAQLVVWDKLLI